MAFETQPSSDESELLEHESPKNTDASGDELNSVDKELLGGMNLSKLFRATAELKNTKIGGKRSSTTKFARSDDDKVTATPDIILKALRHKEDSDKNVNPLSLMHLDDDPLQNPYKCCCSLQETCGHDDSDSCDSD